MFFHLFFCRLARMNPDCGQHFRKNTFAVQTPRIELSERKDHFPGRPEFPPVIEFPSSRTAVFYCNSPYTRSYSIYLLPGDSPFRPPGGGRTGAPPAAESEPQTEMPLAFPRKCQYSRKRKNHASGSFIDSRH